MRVQCKYCGSFIQDTDEKCPNCGAVNEGYVREAGGAPKTIEDLKKWYTAHNLPPAETTRFFIGINYEKPKAFGIYQDGSDFIVYKNKADGSRAVRYKGNDEAYAVNELYQKLKSEIANQKSHQKKPQSANEKLFNVVQRIFLVIICIFAICMLLQIGYVVYDIYRESKNPSPATGQVGQSITTGYYSYDNNTYYNYYDDWYVYNYAANSWEKSENTPNELNDNYTDYFESDAYNDEFGISSFEGSDAYWEAYDNNNKSEDFSSSGSDSWDHSDSWNSSDTWDSGGSDWGGDW